MIGLPGSGKSTWCNEMGLPTISRDTIREEMGIVQSGKKGVGTKTQEDDISKEIERQIIEAIGIRKEFAIDNTNLKRSYRENFINIIKKYDIYGDYSIKYVVMDIPLETCMQRRDGQIPTHVMKRMDEDMDIHEIWCESSELLDCIPWEVNLHSQENESTNPSDCLDRMIGLVEEMRSIFKN